MTSPAAPRIVRLRTTRRVGVAESPDPWARTVAREAAPAVAMVCAMLAGHAPAAMSAAAVALALLSFAYAPLARTRHWAREHLADLWAMLLVMVAMAFMGGSAPGAAHSHVTVAVWRDAAAHSHVTGAVGGAAVQSMAIAGGIAVAGAWLVVRALLARRVWRIHSIVSAAVCGAGLAWMLLV